MLVFVKITKVSAAISSGYKVTGNFIPILLKNSVISSILLTIGCPSLFKTETQEPLTYSIGCNFESVLQLCYRFV